MKVEEAKQLVMAKYPGRVIGKITETDNYFLISIFPESNISTDIIRPIPINDGLKAVDKTTKQVFTYNPIRHN